MLPHIAHKTSIYYSSWCYKHTCSYTNTKTLNVSIVYFKSVIYYILYSLYV